MYSAALENGFTVASLVNDAPVVVRDEEQERTWKPQNFSQRFYGPTRLREAMVRSQNLVSIRLLQAIGIDAARDYITRFGFEKDELPPNLTMSLGSASLTPMSMARGYAVFANGGHLVQPRYIRRIADMDGRVVYETTPSVLSERCDTGEEPLPEEIVEEPTEPAFRPLGLETDADHVDVLIEEPEEVAERLEADCAERTISPQNAYLVRSMMMDVVRRGTGVRAMEMGRNDLAGKTGTTNDQRDAWFSGYNGHLVTTVWVGFDNFEPLGRNEQGGRAALPVWIDYMSVALEGVPDTPPQTPKAWLGRASTPKRVASCPRAATAPSWKFSRPVACHRSSS